MDSKGPGGAEGDGEVQPTPRTRLVRCAVLCWALMVALACEVAAPVAEPIERLTIVDAALPGDAGPPDADALCASPPDCAPAIEWPPLADCAPDQLTGIDGCVDLPACPTGWVALEPGCGPAPPSACGPGQLLLGDGACSKPWPCPAGWRRRGSGPACEPEAHTCAGGACDPWAAPPCGDAPPGARFVESEAPDGGDGSRGAPFRRIADALVGAAPGAVVFLRPGVHPGDVRVPAGVAVVGRCTDEAIVDGLVVLDDDSQLERVTVGGVRVVGRGAVVDAVHIDSQRDDAIEVGGQASLTGRRLRVESGSVRIRRRGELIAERMTVSRAPGTGVHVSGHATLRSVHVRSTRRAGLFGTAVGIGVAGDAILEDVRIEDMIGVALTVSAEDAHVAAERLVVSRVRSLEALTGVGLLVDGATLQVTDALVEGVETAARAQIGGRLTLERVGLEGAVPAPPDAMTVIVSDSTLDFTQLAVSGGPHTALRVDRSRATGRLLAIGPASPGQLGYGVVVRGGGSFVLDGAQIRDRRQAGILISDAGTHAVVRQSSIDRGDRPGMGAAVWGLISQYGATLDATDVRINGGFDHGLTVIEAMATARRVSVRGSVEGVRALRADVELDAVHVEGVAAYGMVIADSDLRVTGLTVLDHACVGGERPQCAGVLAGGSVVSIDGLVGRANGTVGVLGEASEITGRRWMIRDAGDARGLGGGIAVAAGARLDLRHVELTHSRGIGLSIANATASAIVRDLVVRETHAVGATRGGAGLQVDRGARVDVDGARFVDSARVGVLVTASARARLHRVAVGSLERPPTGKGLEVQRGAIAEVDGLHVTDVVGTGVLVVDANARLTGRDIMIEGVSPGAGGATAGFACQEGGRAAVECLTVHNAMGAGVGLLDGSATIRGLELDTIEAGRVWDGYGVTVQDAATLEASYFAIRESARAGVAAFGRHVELSCGVIAGDAVGIECGPETQLSIDAVSLDDARLLSCDAMEPAPGEFVPSDPGFEEF